MKTCSHNPPILSDRQGVNAADQCDFVAISVILDYKTFGNAEIQDLEDLENEEEDRRSIVGYLKWKALAKTIFDLLDSSVAYS